jgi:hypothetical protein
MGRVFGNVLVSRRVRIYPARGRGRMMWGREGLDGRPVLGV